MCSALTKTNLKSLPNGFLTPFIGILGKGKTGRKQLPGIGSDREEGRGDWEDLATSVLEFILYSNKVPLAANRLTLFPEV